MALIGSIWKALYWGDNARVTRTTQADGTASEGVAIENSATGAQVLSSAAGGTERGVAVHVVSQPVSGGGLTDTQLRATPVPVSGTVTATTGGLTDTQLRAVAVPVSLASAPTTAVTGPLTDTQLRATPVPVSGTVTATTGGLTDTQLRASAVPVSLASAPTTTVTGTVALSNTGLNVTGTDGVTANLAATVRQHNTEFVMYVRDPAVVNLLSELLMELRQRPIN